MEKHTLPVKTLLVPMMPQNSTMRIKVVSHAEYEQLSTLPHLETVCHGNNQYLFGVEPFTAVDTAGIQVSCWSQSSLLTTPRISYEQVKNIIEVYGNGYGSRCLTKCIGFNAYRGQRHSKRPHPSPFTDPDQIGEHQYFTDSMKQHLKQPFTEKLLSTLTYRATLFANQRNSLLMEMLGRLLSTKDHNDWQFSGEWEAQATASHRFR